MTKFKYFKVYRTRMCGHPPFSWILAPLGSYLSIYTHSKMIIQPSHSALWRFISLYSLALFLMDMISNIILVYKVVKKKRGRKRERRWKEREGQRKTKPRARKNSPKPKKETPTNQPTSLGHPFGRYTLPLGSAEKKMPFGTTVTIHFKICL